MVMHASDNGMGNSNIGGGATQDDDDGEPADMWVAAMYCGGVSW